MIPCTRCGHENADDATFCATCNAFLEWQARTAAAPDSDVAVALESVPSIVVPGREAGGEVRVRNVGTIVDEFRLQVVGPAAGWTVIEPEVLRLFPRSSQSAQIVFRPPRSPATAAGVTPFGVRVSSSVRTQVVAVESGRVSVDAFEEWQAQLKPEETRGEGGGQHRIEVLNGGNAALTVAVTLSEPPAGVAVDGLPASLTVEPGERASAGLRLRAAGALAPGSERRHAIEVVVESATAAAQRLRGSFLQVGPATRLEWYAKLEPASGWGEAASEHRVQVMNRGNSAVTVSLSARDPAGALAAEVSPAALTVEPGGIGDALVRLRALQPVAPGAEAKRPFEVLAELPNHSQVRLAGEFLQVGPPVQVAWHADLVPLASRSDWGAEHRVAVSNQGNSPLVVEVTPAGAPRGLALDGLPASLSVAAGQVGEVRVWVRALGSVPPGSERVRPFELAVGAAGAAPVRLRGSLTQVGGQAPVQRSQSCLGRLALLGVMLVMLAGLAAFAASALTGSVERAPFLVALVSLAAITAVVLGALALISGSVAVRRLAVAAASVVALALLAALGLAAVLLGSGTIPFGL